MLPISRAVRSIRRAVASALAVAAVGGGALADPPDDEPAPARPETFCEKHGGLALAVAGGVSELTAASLRAVARDGAAWEARATLGAYTPLSLEVSYIGSRQHLDAPGLAPGAMLTGNGLQAGARVKLSKARVYPFVFSAVAWRRYTVRSSSTARSALPARDDVLEVPLGIGVATTLGGLVVDLRGEYRLVTQDEMMMNVSPNVRMDRASVTASLGYAF